MTRAAMASRDGITDDQPQAISLSECFRLRSRAACGPRGPVRVTSPGAGHWQAARPGAGPPGPVAARTD